jgi:hypothetical protein
VALGLAATWGLIAWQARGQWHQPTEIEVVVAEETRDDALFNPWRTARGLAVAVVLLLAFVFGPWPREHVALTAAGVLLMSRKLPEDRASGGRSRMSVRFASEALAYAKRRCLNDTVVLKSATGPTRRMLAQVPL